MTLYFASKPKKNKLTKTQKIKNKKLLDRIALQACPTYSIRYPRPHS